jgi:hypothetical protein
MCRLFHKWGPWETDYYPNGFPSGLQWRTCTSCNRMSVRLLY